MSIRASIETSVPVARAWAWWTDFGPVGGEEWIDHGTGKTLRRVVSRSGSRFVLEERLPLLGAASIPVLRHEVMVDDSARAMVETGPTYTSRWAFEETPSGGTRIVREMFPSGIGRLAPGGLSARLLERDLRAHVRAMERDLQADSRPSGNPK